MLSKFQSTGLIGIATSLVVGALWLALPDVFLSWERTTYDWRLQWQGSAPAQSSIVLIGRDARSDDAFGRGIWDRALFARMIEGLAKAGANVIALDFHFAGESPAERGGAVSDQALVQATRTANTVIYPIPVTPDGSSAHLTAPGGTLQPSVLARAIARTSPRLFASVLQALPPVQPLNGTLPTLLEAAQAIGHIGTFSDEDGVFRRVPLVVNSEGHALPAFGLAIAAAYLQVSQDHIDIIPGDNLLLHQATFPDGTRNDVSIPLDDEGRLLIQYAGRWAEGLFPYFSFKDVWDAIEEGRMAELREQVAGKIVLILHAGLTSDKRRTPLETSVPGGFIHANIINTILLGQAPSVLPSSLGMMLVFGLACLAAFLPLHGGWLKGVVGVVGIAGLYVGLTALALAQVSVVLPVLAPVGAMVLGAGGALVWMTRTATHRVEHLEDAVLSSERELGTTRESLALHESDIERLTEELEVLRTEADTVTEKQQDVSLQVETLQTELAQAQQQVDSARHRVHALETTLAKNTAASVPPTALSTEELETLRSEAESFGLVTRDAQMLSLFRDLKKAVHATIPLLILGETGTGKEVLAQAAHRLSPRAKGPFVPVNVAALSSELVESELFGHVKGAFTGADRDHKGFFEQAHKGTIFLDEIGELKPEVQAKILRVLQDHTFQRVGGTVPVRVEVRVISATNRGLRQGVAQGWFREDLYFRLRGVEFHLPPLRARRDDLEMLAARFVQESAEHAGRVDIKLSQGAMAAITRWAWPGNIRELKSCIERAVILAEGNLITPENLQLEQEPRDPLHLKAGRGVADLDVSGDSAVLLALQQHAFDMQSTARTLGWERSTVTQRLKGMCFAALVDHDSDTTVAAEALAGNPALTRVVEVKVKEYLNHLRKIAAGCSSPDEAVQTCRLRLKNLPDRYMPAMETLIRHHLF